MNRLVCIGLHLQLSVPTTLRPHCSPHIGALPRPRARKHGASPRPAQGAARRTPENGVRRFDASCSGLRCGLSRSCSAASRSPSHTTSRRTRSPDRPPEAPWPCSAPAGRSSGAVSCSGAGIAATPSVRFSSPPASPGFLASGIVRASARRPCSPSGWSSTRRARPSRRGRSSRIRPVGWPRAWNVLPSVSPWRAPYSCSASCRLSSTTRPRSVARGARTISCSSQTSRGVSTISDDSASASAWPGRSC